jgi:hypothetical protein
MAKSKKLPGEECLCGRDGAHRQSITVTELQQLIKERDSLQDTLLRAERLLSVCEFSDPADVTDFEIVLTAAANAKP